MAARTSRKRSRRIEDDQPAVESSNFRFQPQETVASVGAAIFTASSDTTEEVLKKQKMVDEITKEALEQFIDQEAESSEGEEVEEIGYQVPQAKRVALLKMMDLGFSLSNNHEYFASTNMYEMLETETSTVSLTEASMEHVSNKEPPKLPVRQFWQTMLDVGKTADTPEEFAAMVLGLAYDPDDISKRQIARHRNLSFCFGYTVLRKSRWMISESSKFRRALCEPWKGRGYKEYKRFMENAVTKKNAGESSASLY